ncbi:MAG: alpha-mannosidase, partial [Anaerolineae bacterium]
SIHRVYEEAEAAYAQVQESAQEVLKAAQSSLVQAKTGGMHVHNISVYNSLAWQRRELVALPVGVNGALDNKAQPLPVQEIDGRRWAEVTVPSMGWTAITISDHRAHVADGAQAGPDWLENECIKVQFNNRGEIISIYDKSAGRELAAAPCNQLRMFKDVPTNWDAWDLDSTYACNPVPLEESAEITVLASGPLLASLRIHRKLHDSWLTQEVRLARSSRRLDFVSSIEWQERHKLLKVAFPVNIYATEAIHEIQYGHIRRPNHKSRPFDADRFEVSNHKWTALAEENRGCAVLNDCKYGVNVLGNTISLTLLKSAIAPDMTADLGHQVFTYALYAWNGSFAESDLVRQAYELNVPVTVAAGGSGERSLFGVDAPNVILEWVKPAEDASGDIIVRLYEAKRMATRATLNTTLPITAVWRTNMLEEVQAELAVKDGKVLLELRPFEISTLRCKLS